MVATSHAQFRNGGINGPRCGNKTAWWQRIAPNSGTMATRTPRGGRQTIWWQRIAPPERWLQRRRLQQRPLPEQRQDPRNVKKTAWGCKGPGRQDRAVLNEKKALRRRSTRLQRLQRRQACCPRLLCDAPDGWPVFQLVLDKLLSDPNARQQYGLEAIQIQWCTPKSACLATSRTPSLLRARCVAPAAPP